MKKCPDCGEEVQDVEVIFHRCDVMAEKEKPKSGCLMWWLIILSIISGFVWIFSVYTAYIDYTYEGFIAIFMALILIIWPTPLILFLSWRFWQKGKIANSIVFSIGQVLITTLNLFFVISFLAWLSW
jgi:hypothetical protein